MTKKKNRHEEERRADDARTEDEPARRDDRESTAPIGGQGRRDAPGRSGVYPESASERPDPDAPVRTQNAWGQGERGAAGYEDSGTSEVASSEEIRRRIERDRQSAAQRSNENRGRDSNENRGRDSSQNRGRGSSESEDQRSSGNQRSR